MIRTIDIYDTDSLLYFEYLEDFLGPDNVTRSIERVKRTIESEKNNPVYLRYWVLPNASFWIGIDKARQYVAKGKPFAGNLTEEMMRPVELSSKLQNFYANMPDSVQNEFRGRFLSADDITPVLFEIDTAAHFWQLGYSIEWHEAAPDQNTQIPEFSAISASFSFEVECKAKQAHSGRKIFRPTFYRLVDTIGSSLFDQGFVGIVEMDLPGRMPTSDAWRFECATEVLEAAKSGNLNCMLQDGTSITLNIHNIADLSIPNLDLVSQIRKIRTPYANLAIFAEDYDGTPINALIVKAESNSKDEYLRGIFDELRSANRQPTGNLPALLCCLVPEINSFEGLGENSALANMTFSFYENHAKPYVFAVSYTSDTVIETERIAISREYPSITFPNHKYDNSFGHPPSTYSPAE